MKLWQFHVTYKVCDYDDFRVKNKFFFSVVLQTFGVRVCVCVCVCVCVGGGSWLPKMLINIKQQNTLKQLLLWSLWKPKQWQDSVEMWLMMHRKKAKHPSEWQWTDLHGNYIRIIELRKVLHVYMWTSLYATSFFHQTIMMCCQTHTFWGWQNLGTKIKYNTVSLASTGPDSCWIIGYSRSSDSTPTDPCSLRFCSLPSENVTFSVTFISS